MEYKLLGADPVEDKILELDADKVCLVTDTFSKADMFLQSDDRSGYIKLNAPGLYNFTLPQPGGQHDGSTGNVDGGDANANDTDGIEAKLTDKWTREPADEINLIQAQDEKELGLLQRDEATGELYMLLPLEVDVLLQPEQEQLRDLLMADANANVDVDVAGAEQPTVEEGEADAVVDADAEDDDDHADASQTTLTEAPLLLEEEEEEEEQQREVCRFVVPKMSLNFQLTLQIGNMATD